MLFVSLRPVAAERYMRVKKPGVIVEMFCMHRCNVGEKVVFKTVSEIQ